jgi:uncharacterized membrane protein YedE/YeeE
MNTAQSSAQSLALNAPVYLATSFLAGLLFAIGLGVSGMTQAQKVIGFLDITSLEQWNPALMWVMVGAIGVFATLRMAFGNRPKPLVAPDWCHIPPRANTVPLKVATGNVLFGVGWGLAGYCPGPAIVSATSLGSEPLMFTAAMVLGFLGAEWFLKA